MTLKASTSRQISLENIQETREPLNEAREIAGDAKVLNGAVEGSGMKVFPAQWRQGKWIVFGLAVRSSTGEIVAKVPKSKRLADRSKYDGQGRLKSKPSESE